MAVGVFSGHLIAHSDGTNPLPNKFIDYNSYDSSPKQREEIKAERDDNTRLLVRVTASGMKTAIHFRTRDGLHLADKVAFMQWFKSLETDAARQKQRTVDIQYWDDDVSDYDTGTFYLANFKFPIKRITDNDIIYGSVDIDLIEY